MNTDDRDHEIHGGRNRKHGLSELREILQFGDPAGDGAEPAPGEASRMRRVILAQTTASRPARGPFPAWTAVGLVMVAVAVFLAGVVIRGRPAPGPDESPGEDPRAS